MCRFVLYLGPEISLSSLVTEPENSIINQSVHSHELEEPLNGDGFGVAWYAPEITENPVIFKDITPAWNNMNLLNVAPVIRSSCVLAHVRAATPGLPVTRLNCHPFAWGPFAFMHNGEVAGFKSIRREILKQLSDEAFNLIAGTTDTEYVFALFVDHFRKIEKKLKREEAMVHALKAAIADVDRIASNQRAEKSSTLNLVVTDGSRAVVSRYITDGSERANTLYVNRGRKYECSGDVCQMLDPGKGSDVVLIASEPLSTDEGWEPVPVNHLLIVDRDLTVTTRPIAEA